MFESITLGLQITSSKSGGCRHDTKPGNNTNPWTL